MGKKKWEPVRQGYRRKEVPNRGLRKEDREELGGVIREFAPRGVDALRLEMALCEWARAQFRKRYDQGYKNGWERGIRSQEERRFEDE